VNKQTFYTILFDTLIRLSKQSMVFIVGLFLVFGAVAVAQLALEKTTTIHWSIGLIAAVVTLFGIVWLLSWIKNAPYTPSSFGYYPRLGLALNLILVVLTAIVAMSFVSFILFTQDVASFESIDPITVPRLLDYHSWHFIDSIPIVGIWEIFEIKPRIKAVDSEARALLEVFHVLIVATVIRTFLGKKGSFKRLLKTAKVYRMAGEYDKAKHTLDIALKNTGISDDAIKLADANIEYAKIFIKHAPEKVTASLDEAVNSIDRAEYEMDLEHRKTEVRNLRYLFEDREK